MKHVIFHPTFHQACRKNVGWNYGLVCSGHDERYFPSWLEKSNRDPVHKKQNKKLLKRLSRSSQQSCPVRKGVLQNFAKFTGNRLGQSLFLNKDAGLKLATLLKKRVWHSWFPVNFAKFLRTLFFTEHVWANASDYQPISLLSIFGKVYEGLIFNLGRKWER